MKRNKLINSKLDNDDLGPGVKESNLETVKKNAQMFY